MTHSITSLISRAGRALLPSSASSTPSPANAKPGRSHGLTGFLGDLQSLGRARRNKVHPEPMNQPPRAELSPPRQTPAATGPAAGQLPVPATLVRTAHAAAPTPDAAPALPPSRPATPTAQKPGSPAPSATALQGPVRAQLPVPPARVQGPPPQVAGTGSPAASQPAARLARAPAVRPAELAQARAIVAEGPPDLGKMFSTAIDRVEHNNRINQLYSSLLKPEDRVNEEVDFRGIERGYQQKLARYEQAKGVVDAASVAAQPGPSVTSAPAAARTQAAVPSAGAPGPASPRAQRTTRADAPAGRSPTADAGRPSPPAAQHDLTRPFRQSFEKGDLNRDFSAEQMVAVLQMLAKGTQFEQPASDKAAKDPTWGERMSQNWTALRQQVSQASQSGDPRAPTLRQIVGDPNPTRRDDLIAFLATGQGMERLVPQRPPAVATQVDAGHPTRPPQRARADAVPPAAAEAGRMPSRAGLRDNLQEFMQGFRRGDLNRDYPPEHMVAVMQRLARGTKFETDVRDKIAADPNWGQKMSKNWSELRHQVMDARASGQPQVPSLTGMIADNSDVGRANIIRFLATGRGIERLVPPPTSPREEPVAQATVRPDRKARLTEMGAAMADLNQHLAGRRTQAANARPQAPARPAAGPDAQALRQAEETVRRGEPRAPERWRTDREAAEIADYRNERPSRALEDEVFDRANDSYERRLASYNAARDMLAQARAPGGAAPTPVPTAAARAAAAADKAARAELASARAIVAEGKPDLYAMYQAAERQVEAHNKYLPSYEPEDQVPMRMDHAAVDKDYDQKLERYEKARATVHAADHPEQAQAQAAAFQAEVRTEARQLAQQAYNSEVHDARETVRRGPVSYATVQGWARDEAARNYMMVGSERLDHDAITRQYDAIRANFEAAKRLLDQPLTAEQSAARIDAQMGEAERRVKQRQTQAGA